MAEDKNKSIIQFKRGLSSDEEFMAYAPASGEPVFITDLNLLKVGDGTSAIEDISSPPSEQSVFFVDNHTNSTIYKGQAVYATGVIGGGKIISIDKYVADGSIDEIRFLGLSKTDINHGSQGEVLEFGHLSKLNTSNSNVNPSGNTWLPGDILYADPNTAGGLVNFKPQEAISVAMVLTTGNNGELFIRPTNFGHLDDKHDVQIANVASGDGLIYNSSSQLWENVTVPKSDITGIVGNASGVYNIVIVDSDTYSSITKDPNTIYFVP